MGALEGCFRTANCIERAVRERKDKIINHLRRPGEPFGNEGKVLKTPQFARGLRV